MAQLARLEFTVLDASGNAVSGASVQVVKQGAQINGAQAGPATTITVDDPGAIVAGDIVYVNAAGVTRSVSSITATTVVVGSPGFSDMNDDDRLVSFSPGITLYEDAVGNTTKVNPTTTDANGYVAYYVLGGKYDVVITGGGLANRLLQDVAAVGGESTRSNIYSGTAWKLDSLRALAATDIALDVSNAGVNKLKVMGDGEIVSGAAGATHNLTGTLTTSGALTVSSGGAAITGATSTTTDLTFRRPFATNGTAVVAGDIVASAGWGNTPNPVISITTGSTDTRGRVIVTSGGAGLGANPTLTFTFKDGAYGANSFMVATRGGEASSPSTAFWTTSVGAAGSIVITFIGTPAASTNYGLTWMMMG